VLAAGCSSRLGRNKQLVVYEGETLVRRAVRIALEAGVDRVLVVTGFEPERLAAALVGIPCELVPNPRWAEGMGASVAAGVVAAQASTPRPEGLLVVLPDQALVPSRHLAALLTAGDQNAATIIATTYAGTSGAPVLFKALHFAALAALPPAAGARKLLDRHPDQVLTLPCEAAAQDLDTPADFAVLKGRDSGDNDPQVT
jgi:molybdenum cofactor cytidylyltransferase